MMRFIFEFFKPPETLPVTTDESFVASLSKLPFSSHWVAFSSCNRCWASSLERSISKQLSSLTNLQNADENQCLNKALPAPLKKEKFTLSYSNIYIKMCGNVLLGNDHMTTGLNFLKLAYFS